MKNHEITRKILAKIHNEPAISQKRMADEIGISVGMINWHIRRCANKGLIKFKHAPVRRYLYYLTPAGFAEKTRLTASYLQSSLDIFKTGRVQYEALFRICRKNGWKNVGFFGDTELTELASLVAGRFDDINVIFIIDEKSTRTERYGIPIVKSLQECFLSVKITKIDAVLACNYLISNDEFTLRDSIFRELEAERLSFLVPKFLQ